MVSPWLGQRNRGLRGAEMKLERFKEMDSDAGMYEHKDGAWVGYDDVRELIASWMIQHGYSTGHGETIEDLLEELEWQTHRHTK